MPNNYRVFPDRHWNYFFLLSLVPVQNNVSLILTSLLQHAPKSITSRVRIVTTTNFLAWCRLRWGYPIILGAWRFVQTQPESAVRLKGNLDASARMAGHHHPPRAAQARASSDLSMGIEVGRATEWLARPLLLGIHFDTTDHPTSWDWLQETCAMA